jgi:DMSO/TMAO reductase YedYZ molybdopterin-dependent catalytic subunit
MDIPRRQFMFLALGALLRADDRPKRDMLTRSARPEDLEMPLSGFADYITPIDRFFVRTHVAVPTVNPASWRLNVDGEVTAPLTLTMQDVRGLPSVELVAVVECAGNGRRFYDPPVPGVQWGNGAVGNGRWRGVRLAEVLKKVGVKDSAREVLFGGADVPLGTMPDFERSIPIKKALDANTLLAYDMNGETLPAKHGFPLRVIVPGWAGDSWTKWVTSIRVLDREHDGFWMKRAYRHPGKAVAPGTLIAPDQMQPVTSLRVKSVIAGPIDGESLRVGAPVLIRGTAWSGDAGPVDAVDVSVDGGRRWSLARLRRDQRTQFGWRQWEFNWTPSQDAYYTLLARARDAAGNTQPLDQEWNPSGYGWNVVPRVGINVVRELPGERAHVGDPSAGSVTTVAQPASFRTSCGVCHQDDLIRQQRLTRADWNREIDKMVGWGARMTDEDRVGVLDYLSGNFGPRPR